MAEQSWISVDSQDLVLDLKTDFAKEKATKTPGEREVEVSISDAQEAGVSTLPHSNIESVVKVSFTFEDGEDKANFGVRIKMDEGRYCLAVEEDYIQMLNGEELSLEQGIQSISPHVGLPKITHRKGQLIARFNPRAITDLSIYSKSDVRSINRIWEDEPKMKLHHAVKPFSNLGKRTFYLIVSSFSNKSEPAKGFYQITRPKAIKTVKAAVVVHGLASRISNEYDMLTEYLKDEEYDVFGFDYYTIGKSITENGCLLAKEIDHIKAKYDEVVIVAHSMGGLVSRSALVNEGAKVDKLIMAGTPNNGSSLAGKTNLVKILATIFMKKNWIDIKNEDYQDLIWDHTSGLKDLFSKSSFIKKLKKRDSLDTKRRYFALSGARLLGKDWIVKTKDTYSIDTFKIPHIERKWHHFQYFKKYELKDTVGFAIDYLP